MIPDVVSFDLDMIEIFDKVRLKGLFSYDNKTRIIPIFEETPLKILESMIEKKSFEDYFQADKTFAGNVWQNENTFPTNRELRDKLESEVINLLIA